MHVEIRKFQCPLWTKIETIFSKYFCGQHLCIYLMCIGGFINEAEFIQNDGKTTSATIGDICHFLQMWSLFEVLVSDPLEIRKIISSLRQLQSIQGDLFVEKEIVVYYPEGRTINLGNFLIYKPFSELRLFFDQGHIIPVSEKKYHPAVLELCGKPFVEKFSNLFEDKKRSTYPTPVCIPSQK